MKLSHSIAVIILGLAVITASLSMFTVDQTEQAIVLQLGQPIGSINNPGLHFKIPFVQDVRRFDRRILSVDPKPQQMVISSSNRDSVAAPVVPADQVDDTDDVAQNEGTVSGEPIIVNTFVRYRITDPLKFMKTLRTVDNADQRLESIVNDATRSALGKTTLRTLLSPDRTAIMEDIRKRVNGKVEHDQLGIEIIDVRIVRADLTPELRQSTVRRMISELTEYATETRAHGEERALEIRSTAEKERSVLLAEAERDAQIMRGDGDKEAIGIYAAAYSKDQDFYSFMRSMEAYRNTLAQSDTRLILSPDSSFFKYFKNGQ